MKKSIFLFLSLLVLTVSCGENKQERQDRIEKETAKILITYNEAISVHKKEVNNVLESARFFNLSNFQLEISKGENWQQKGWDTLRAYYKIDSLQASFKNSFGEDDHNVLQLKIDNNWNQKME